MFVKSIPDAVKADGTIVKYEVGKGYNLVTGTWYIESSLPDPSTLSIHCLWDAAIVLTSVKYHSSNVPAFKSISQPYTDNAAGVDAALNAAPTTGLWIPKTLAAAPDVVGAGATSSTAGFAVTGGAAGGGVITLANNADRRGRTEVVVGATGGFYRQYTHGKQA